VFLDFTAARDIGLAHRRRLGAGAHWWRLSAPIPYGGRGNCKILGPLPPHHETCRAHRQAARRQARLWLRDRLAIGLPPLCAVSSTRPGAAGVPKTSATNPGDGSRCPTLEPCCLIEHTWTSCARSPRISVAGQRRPWCRRCRRRRWRRDPAVKAVYLGGVARLNCRDHRAADRRPTARRSVLTTSRSVSPRDMLLCSAATAWADPTTLISSIGGA